MSSTHYEQDEDVTTGSALITGPSSDGGVILAAVERIPHATDPERREHWSWRIIHLDAAGTNGTRTSSSDHDRIRSGANGTGGGPRLTMLALAGFLGAYAEAREGSENADLFPASLDRTTAQDCADLITVTLGEYA